MAITLSEILEDAVQADGRRHIRERHTDHTGVFHFVRYMAESDVDATAVLATRALALPDYLAQQAIEILADAAGGE